jgi:hypothetical protein
MLHQSNAERTPQTAPSFLEPGDRTQNNNALAVRTVPNSELRSARGIIWAWSFRLDPALDVTAVALTIIRGSHALHFSCTRG